MVESICLSWLAIDIFNYKTVGRAELRVTVLQSQGSFPHNTLYLWNEVGNPHFYGISDTSNSLSKKKSIDWKIFGRTSISSFSAGLWTESTIIRTSKQRSAFGRFVFNLWRFFFLPATRSYYVHTILTTTQLSQKLALIIYQPSVPSFLLRIFPDLFRLMRCMECPLS